MLPHMNNTNTTDIKNNKTLSDLITKAHDSMVHLAEILDLTTRTGNWFGYGGEQEAAKVNTHRALNHNLPLTHNGSAGEGSCGKRANQADEDDLSSAQRHKIDTHVAPSAPDSTKEELIQRNMEILAARRQADYNHPDRVWNQSSDADIYFSFTDVPENLWSKMGLNTAFSINMVCRGSVLDVNVVCMRAV